MREESYYRARLPVKLGQCTGHTGVFDSDHHSDSLMVDWRDKTRWALIYVPDVSRQKSYRFRSLKQHVPNVHFQHNEQSSRQPD